MSILSDAYRAVATAYNTLAAVLDASVVPPIEQPPAEEPPVPDTPLVVQTAGWGLQPAGLTVITENPMNVVKADEWGVNNDSGYLTIVKDPTAPVSPPNVLQFRYPVGFVGSEAPGNLHCSLKAKRNRVYVGMYWKPSNPWHGHWSNVNKIAFLMCGGDGGGSIYLAMYGPPGGPYEILVEQAIRLPDGTTNVKWHRPNLGKSARVTLGAWHKLEWSVDGSRLRVGVNGVLVTDDNTLPIPAEGYVEFQFSPTWGGMGRPDGTPGEEVKRQADTYLIDHACVAVG